MDQTWSLNFMGWEKEGNYTRNAFTMLEKCVCWYGLGSASPAFRINVHVLSGGRSSAHALDFPWLPWPPLASRVGTWFLCRHLWCESRFHCLSTDYILYRNWLETLNWKVFYLHHLHLTLRSCTPLGLDQQRWHRFACLVFHPVVFQIFNFFKTLRALIFINTATVKPSSNYLKYASMRPCWVWYSRFTS